MKDLRGFTLIETLIYLALFALIVGGFAATAYGYFETAGGNETRAMLQEEADFALDSIRQAIAGASALHAAGALLTLTEYDGSSDTFAISHGALVRNGAPLTNTNVMVSGLTFIETDPPGVAVSFTLTARTPEGATLDDPVTATEYLHL